MVAAQKQKVAKVLPPAVTPSKETSLHQATGKSLQLDLQTGEMMAVIDTTCALHDILTLG